MCGTWQEHAGEGFEGGWDKLQRVGDFWMPLDQKIDWIGKGFGQLINIVPTLFEDLGKCELFTTDMQESTDWVLQNWNPIELTGKVFNNVITNIFPLTDHLMQAIGSMNAGEWYKFGQQLGTNVKIVIQ